MFVHVVLSTINFYFFIDLNCLVKKLDKRSIKNATNCQLKPQIWSTPSTQGPPDGALRWAVSSSWLEDKENFVSNSVPSACKVLDIESDIADSGDL